MINRSIVLYACMNFSDLLQAKATARQKALNVVMANPPQVVLRVVATCSGDVGTSFVPTANPVGQAKKEGNA